MKDEEHSFYYATNSPYQRIIQQDGLRTTICDNRFELCTQPLSDINEQTAVQSLKDWIRGRKKRNELRDAGDLSK